MWCNQIFSLIADTKIKNIIVCDNYEIANRIAKMTYGENAFATETTLYPVMIDDTYENGEFYRGEGASRVIIPRNPTEQEAIDSLDRTVMIISPVSQIAFVLMAENGMVDDVTASEHAEVFDTWRSEGVAYKVGNIRRDGDYLYRCLTDHISQASWTPAASPSLWVRISDPAEEYPLWSQPIGSTDAYMKGDKVTFEGKHYVSDYDNNTWSPATFGWSEVE